MHHKRRHPKARRAGCLLCKPSKLNAHKTADRVRAREAWRRDWGVRQGPIRRRRLRPRT